jgi:serine/threonine-protein kinase
LDRIRLQGDEWSLEKRIGTGGFGQVYRAASKGRVCAIKLVPKEPGADRELLFVDLARAENVVPVLEVGETEDSWALRMPLAEQSLRQMLEEDIALSLDRAVVVLLDVCTALASIADRVIHRDIKPENILLLDGTWCLADFGIARYAEATTDAETRKFALTPAYTAPERWRHERATHAADVYSVGVTAFEMMSGRLPFEGPRAEDFRGQHLHDEATPLEGVPTQIAALVDECLYKAPEARPTAANLVTRLRRVDSESVSEGRARLMAANLAQVRLKAEAARSRSREQTEQERRRGLADAAARAFGDIGRSLQQSIESDAPAATITATEDEGWEARLGPAVLSLSAISSGPDDQQWQGPFDVISHSMLALTTPRDRNGYEGRSHSLWFCDARDAGSFAWFETAFMFMPLLGRSAAHEPFALDPSGAAALAVSIGMTDYQVAWPFEELARDGLQGFLDRWLGWFADAATDRLFHPSSMPERPVQGSWRTR